MIGTGIRDKTLKGIVIFAGIFVLAATALNLSYQIKLNRHRIKELDL